MLRFPRFGSSVVGFTRAPVVSAFTNPRIGSPRTGSSILTTSAPQSARTPAAAGTNSHEDTSTTLTPFKMSYTGLSRPWECRSRQASSEVGASDVRPSRTATAERRGPAVASRLRSSDEPPAEGLAALREGHVLAVHELDVGEALQRRVLSEVHEVDRHRREAAVGPVVHLAQVGDERLAGR